MAIVPFTYYSGQTAGISSNYLYGSARNRSAPGSYDGTPLEEGWINDIWGFLQRLLYQSGTSPSNVPDTMLVSDYHDALLKTISTAHVYNGDQFYVDSGGIFYTAFGGEQRLWGTQNVKSTGAIEVNSGGDLNVNSGGNFNFDAGCNVIIGDVTDITAVAYTGKRYFVPCSDDQGIYWQVISSFNAALYWEQTDINTGNHFRFGLEGLPRGVTITAVIAHVKGASGHAGLPAVVPAVALGQLNVTTGTITSVGIAGDPSVSVGGYQGYHFISLTGLSQSLNTSNPYIISFRGESTTNALVGLQVYAIEVQYSTTEIHTS